MTLKELWGHGPVVTRGGRVGWYVGVGSGDFKKVIFSDSPKHELGPTFTTPTQKLKFQTRSKTNLFTQTLPSFERAGYIETLVKSVSVNVLSFLKFWV